MVEQKLYVVQTGQKVIQRCLAASADFMSASVMPRTYLDFRFLKSRLKGE
jgi:hypothetical protein